MKYVKCLLVILFLFVCHMSSIVAYDDSYFIEAENGFLCGELEDPSRAVSMLEENSKMRSVASFRVIKIPFKVTRKSDGNYFMWSDISFIKYEGRIGYCVDPLTKLKTSANYHSNSYEDVLSDTQRNEVSKIMYYGYTYPNHHTDNYYLATQKLIWEYLGYSVKYYAKNSNFTGNYDLSYEIGEIKRLLGNHDKQVSFHNREYELMVGDRLTLVDENGVLSDYVMESVDGVDIQHEGNFVHIVANKPLDGVNIHFYKGDRKVPDEFLLSHVAKDSQTFVTIVSGAIEPLMASFSLRVKAVGDVVIKKIDKESKEALGGVRYRIARDVEFTEGLQEVVTDNEGLISLKDLEVGTYYYQELDTIEGYVLDSSVGTFTVKENETTRVLCENMKQKVKLYIQKMASNKADFMSSEASLDGAEYLLLASDKVTVLERIKAQEEGVWADTLLDVNTTYYLQEVVAPKGMMINPELIVVYENYQTDVKEIKKEVLFYDDVIKNTITIQKYVNTYIDETVNIEKGRNFAFDIYNHQNIIVDTIITDDEGKASSKYLPYGTYIIKEQQKEGYIPLEPFIVSIDSSSKEYRYELVNEPLDYDLTINKINKWNEPIENVCYRIARDSNMQEMVVEKTTNEKGKVIFKNLLPGIYYVQEMYAPNMYIVDDKIYEIEVNGDKEITFVNQKKEIELCVVKKNNQNEPLAHARFVLKDSHGKQLEGITDDIGRLSFKVPYGQYELQEIEAPEGYLLLDKKIDIEIKDDEKVIVEVVNEKKEVEIRVHKYNEEGNAIQGVKFKLIDENGNFKESITDSNGEIVFVANYGNYQLLETETLSQYVKGDEVIDIVVDKDEPIDIYVENVYKDVELVIHKLNEKGEPLANTKFILTNNEGYLEELVSDEYGVARSVVHYGNYQLQEIEAAEGYELLDKIIDIEISDDTVVNGKFEKDIYNYPRYVDICVYKQNEEEIPLEGALFELVNTHGEKIIGSTNEEGIVVFTVGYGTYILHEIEAPSGYMLSNESYTIVIDDGVESTYDVVVMNKKISVVNTATPQMAPWTLLVMAIISLVVFVYLRFFR